MRSFGVDITNRVTSIFILVVIAFSIKKVLVLPSAWLFRFNTSSAYSRTRCEDSLSQYQQENIAKQLYFRNISILSCMNY